MYILRLFSRLWRQAGAWRRGRRWAYLLQALPAIFAAAALLVPTFGALSTPTRELESRYLGQAKSAFRVKDFAGALTCYDRLAYLGSQRPDVLYGLALSAEALGQAGRAEVVMNGLTPPDEPGYAQAHMWQARHLLSGHGAAAGAGQAAESHLLRALDGELDDREAAHALFGELYLADKQFDQAEMHLTKAVKAKPQLRIRLAQLYALRGDKERARGEAQLAISYFRARTKGDLQDIRARLGWADAEAFLEDFPDAVAILREGLSVSDEPVYRTALGGVYYVWADTLSRDPNSSPGEGLALVETGLRYDPSNVGLLDRLLAAVKVHGPEADKARDALQALLASGQATASVHFALGLDAWERGKADEARMHLERANALAPQMPTIANNLAWVLARSEPADLPKALELSNLAVEQAPKELNFRDTRGRVFAKMGRWKEALADLEAALPGDKDNADLHKVLAEVYEHLGAPDMAAEHKRLAEKKPESPAQKP